MELKISEQEKNIILKALYYYDDITWFHNQKNIEILIKKIEKVSELNNEELLTCDT